MAVAVLAGASYAVQTPPRAAEKEAALGRQLAAEFRQRNAIIESSAVQTYLDQLARRIAAGLPDGKMPFRFSLTASDSCRATHEPVALPGGYVFVPAALFAEARDENEFAGVLAHAMSHVALHHAMRSAPRAQVSNLASIPLIFLGGGRSCGDELLIPLAYVPILRAQELEADEAAVRALASAGFDPKALVQYIERLRPKEKQRLDGLRSRIESLPPANYSAPSPDFVNTQTEVRHLMDRRAQPPTLKRSYVADRAFA